MNKNPKKNLTYLKYILLKTKLIKLMIKMTPSPDKKDIPTETHRK